MRTAAAHLVQQLARGGGLHEVLGDHVSRHLMRVLELAREGLQPLGAPRHEHEMPAVARDAAGERLADAARGAGDERHLLRHANHLRVGVSRSRLARSRCR